jgi:hypothetical protein
MTILRFHAIVAALLCGAAVLAAGPAHDRAAALRLFGVEIGGPEDGFSLADRSKFESAKKVGARFIDLRPIWSTLEPRPGVYDWSTLDAAFANAAAVGLPVTITTRFFDTHVPAWLASENMIDQEGRTFFGYSREKSFNPSYWGPRARRSYLRLVEAMVRRYRDRPSLLAWQFFYGYNDSFYLGMWAGSQTIYDYSKFSQERYRHYLSRVKKFSLGEVNARHGTSYRSWSEVAQPQPLFGALNVTRAWHDFQEYRMWSIERMFDDIDRTVRRLDQRPLIMYYGGSLHHSAHQLSAYDVGLPLLRKYGGVLDVTCFEDPVPAEIGAGIVRAHGVPLMAEAWQVPPPLPDFRRMFFHIFSLGVKSYQMVGNWEKMKISPAEFERTSRVFLEVAQSQPVRAPVAGLFSYTTIQSHIPARHYINPTLAIIPKLQERQVSLDWFSDRTPLDKLNGYTALLDANSEVLPRPVIDRLIRFVERGGRLVLMERSGRYALEEGKPDYPLLTALGHAAATGGQFEEWSFGKGRVLRLARSVDWASPEGSQVLNSLTAWLQVDRPITATPGVLAALTRGPGPQWYVILHWPGAQPQEASFTIRSGLLQHGRNYRLEDLLSETPRPAEVPGASLKQGFNVSLRPHELKVFRLTQ